MQTGLLQQYCAMQYSALHSKNECVSVCVITLKELESFHRIQTYMKALFRTWCLWKELPGSCYMMWYCNYHCCELCQLCGTGREWTDVRACEWVGSVCWWVIISSQLCRHWQRSLPVSRLNVHCQPHCSHLPRHWRSLLAGFSVSYCLCFSGILLIAEVKTPSVLMRSLTDWASSQSQSKDAKWFARWCAPESLDFKALCANTVLLLLLPLLVRRRCRWHCWGEL